MLSDNCDKIEEVDHMRSFSAERLVEMKERLSDVSIEISDVEQEKKAQNEIFKTQAKPLIEEKKKLLSGIKNKAEQVKEKCFKFVDQNAGEVGYYTNDGILVYSRPIMQDERQMTIHTLSRKTGTND